MYVIIQMNHLNYHANITPRIITSIREYRASRKTIGVYGLMSWFFTGHFYVFLFSSGETAVFYISDEILNGGAATAETQSVPPDPDTKSESASNS